MNRIDPTEAILPENFEKKLLHEIQKSKLHKNIFEIIMEAMFHVFKIFLDTVELFVKKNRSNP